MFLFKRTHAPNNIFAMVIAKLEMTETISGDLTAKVLHMSMKEVRVFYEMAFNQVVLLISQ